MFVKSFCSSVLSFHLLSPKQMQLGSYRLCLAVGICCQVVPESVVDWLSNLFPKAIYGCCPRRDLFRMSCFLSYVQRPSICWLSKLSRLHISAQRKMRKKMSQNYFRRSKGGEILTTMSSKIKVKIEKPSLWIELRTTEKETKKSIQDALETKKCMYYKNSIMTKTNA